MRTIHNSFWPSGKIKSWLFSKISARSALGSGNMVTHVGFFRTKFIQFYRINGFRKILFFFFQIDHDKSVTMLHPQTNLKLHFLRHFFEILEHLNIRMDRQEIPHNMCRILSKENYPQKQTGLHAYFAKKNTNRDL